MGVNLNAFYSVVSASGCSLISRATGEILETLPIVSATDEHRNYILSTWVKSYETTARTIGIGVPGGPVLRVDQEAFRSRESRIAEREWKKSKVIVAPGDAYTIHGWVCAAPGRLWHVYVPPSLRSCGVAKGLVVSTAGKNYTVAKPWPKQPSGHSVHWCP